MSEKPKYVSAGATISACGTYRYSLWREWRGTPNAKWDMWKNDDGSPVLDGAGAQVGEPETVTFIMLNPSTADGKADDPTIRRCVSFARAWGYDRMVVVNLFAYRATDPRALLALNHQDDPVGANNQSYIERLTGERGIVVCAWGAHGAHLEQDETALGWVYPHAKIFCLGRTKEGHPRHPLYVPASQELEPFNGRLAPLPRQGGKGKQE